LLHFSTPAKTLLFQGRYDRTASLLSTTGFFATGLRWNYAPVFQYKLLRGCIHILINSLLSGFGAFTGCVSRYDRYSTLPLRLAALRIVAIAGYDSSLRLASHNIQRTLQAVQLRISG